MKFSGYIFLVVLSGVFLLQTAYAIKCFNCNSDEDPKCGDPFDNTSIPIVNCAKISDFEPDLPHIRGVTSGMCKKIKQKLNGKWHYTRFCHYGLPEPADGTDKSGCSTTLTESNRISMVYCTCNGKDACNGANELNFNGVISVISMVTVARMLRA